MKCFSGGAEGADTIFENLCIKNNIEIKAFSFDNHFTLSKNRIILSSQELNEGFENVKIAEKSLKRNISVISNYVRNLLSRNWFQVKNSDTIFAVSFLANSNSVKGGTGWAVQMAIDNRKPVFIFDMNKNKWFFFNYELNSFEQYNEIPKLTENFAGIGSREINENGIKAIKQLFKNL